MTISTATTKEEVRLDSPFEETDDPLPDAHDDQPDPVTLSHPSFDGDGLLRWASTTFGLRR